MTKVVLDTNIIVSALLSPNGTPAHLLDLVLNGRLQLCYDSRIICEYEEVLTRPKFGFSKRDVRILIEFFKVTGISIIPIPILTDFNDDDDKKFYEVMQICGAYLITGKTKHFPDDDNIFTPAQFLDMMMSK